MKKGLGGDSLKTAIAMLEAGIKPKDVAQNRGCEIEFIKQLALEVSPKKTKKKVTKKG